MARNWFRLDATEFPIDTLPAKGPVELLSEDRTVRWLSEDKPSAKAVDHQGEKVAPAFWAPVRIEESEG